MRDSGKLRRFQPPGPTRIDRWRKESEIESINLTPMAGLSFGHFLDLKSGRDSLSGVRLEELKRRVSATDLEIASTEFRKDEKALAACLRWTLRGLNIDKAIRKVRTDQEVSQNAAMSRRNR